MTRCKYMLACELEPMFELDVQGLGKVLLEN